MTRMWKSASRAATGVAAGAVVGALLLSPVLSNAEDTSPSATPDLTSPSSPEGRGSTGHHRGPSASFDAVATLLGMTEDEVKASVAGGTSLADLAESKGTSRADLVDALVTAGTERIEAARTDGSLTDAQADEMLAALPDRVDTLVDATDLPMGRGHGRGGPGGLGGPSLSTVAELVDMTEADVRSALSDGTTLAELAESTGVDRDTLVDALVADARERIEAMVDQQLTRGDKRGDATETPTETPTPTTPQTSA